MTLKRILIMGFAALSLSVGSYYVTTAWQSQNARQTQAEAEKDLSPNRLMARAGWLAIEGRNEEAKSVYRQVHQQFPDALMSKIAEARLVEEGYADYFSTLNDTNADIYTVSSGDSLHKIAMQYDLTPGLIRVANGLKNDQIRPYQKLKIPREKMRILVDKSTNVLIVKVGDRVLKTYPVGTGKSGNTPPGEFKIVSRLKDPAWYYEGVVAKPRAPDNPLGTRWMGFDLEGYGIHGTTDPTSIGKYETLGCIRLYNEDVEELFEIVPTGTDVSVIESAQDAGLQVSS